MKSLSIGPLFGALAAHVSAQELVSDEFEGARKKAILDAGGAR